MLMVFTKYGDEKLTTLTFVATYVRISIGLEHSGSRRMDPNPCMCFAHKVKMDPAASCKSGSRRQLNSQLWQ